MRRSILVLVIVLLNAPVQLCKADLVGRWTFNEGTGTTAYDSANNNDGTIYGGAQWTTGGALGFDGVDDYVNVGSSPGLTSLTPAGMTIEVWICNTRTISAGVTDVRTIVGQRDYKQSNGYGLLYGYHVGAGVDDYFVTVVFFGGYQGLVNYEILPGERYHIAGVSENNIATIYINGIAQPTWMLNSGCTPSTADVMIGRHGNYLPGLRDDFHQGLIDEVRIYNHALTEAEIVPVPGAVILGSIGLGMAGWKLRRRRTL